MNEFIIILSLLLSFAVAVYIVITLIEEGYDMLIYCKNKRIDKRIEILYRIGMAETANILQTPLLKYYHR